MGQPSTSQNPTNVETPLRVIPIITCSHAVKKRKTSSSRTLVETTRGLKKLKFNHDTINPSEAIHLSIPIGTQWQNNSCAYDAVYTVLFNIYGMKIKLLWNPAGENWSLTFSIRWLMRLTRTKASHQHSCDTH